ncbi:hypothetical protein [Nocardia neocaledoniensis]|uniref:hypothetical protein n=1 Tax=Nocardia neocaledoniensis TaxID=236511 RepID=UPI002454F4CD|nr:hypothetical protein [Nocardia neocaledoniensis]
MDERDFARGDEVFAGFRFERGNLDRMKPPTMRGKRDESPDEFRFPRLRSPLE